MSGFFNPFGPLLDLVKMLKEHQDEKAGVATARQDALRAVATIDSHGRERLLGLIRGESSPWGVESWLGRTYADLSLWELAVIRRAQTLKLQNIRRAAGVSVSIETCLRFLHLFNTIDRLVKPRIRESISAEASLVRLQSIRYHGTGK